METGDVTAAAGMTRAEPQTPQNRASAGISCPHWAQSRTAGTPQTPQNAVPGGSSAPHSRQRAMKPPSAFGGLPQNPARTHVSYHPTAVLRRDGLPAGRLIMRLVWPGTVQRSASSARYTSRRTSSL